VNRADALAEAYEVVLSFVDEDREYVSEVTQLLKDNDVSLFYDIYEQATLWAKTSWSICTRSTAAPRVIALCSFPHPVRRKSG
jgi:hypothetical protein